MSENNTLTHHGIKGQRWGVRRYQNPDGSLTKAGKKRRETEDNDKKELEKKSSAPAASKGSTSTAGKPDNIVEDPEVTKQRVLKSGSANEVLKYQGQLTSQELQGVYQRLNNEQLIRAMAEKNAPQKKTIFQQIESVVSAGKTVYNAATFLKDGYNLTANIANSFGANWRVLDGGKSASDAKKDKNEKFLRTATARQVTMKMSEFSTEELKNFAIRMNYADKIRDAATSDGEWLGK